MGEIDNLINDPDYQEESADVRQTMLDNIYTGFMQFPFKDLEIDSNGNTLLKGFGHIFKSGTTTPGFSDQIGGKYNTTDNILSIFYAKGIHTGWIKLQKGLDEKVELLSARILRKDGHGAIGRDVTKTPGKSMDKPHLHAIESLILQAQSEKLSNDPNPLPSIMLNDLKDELLLREREAIAQKIDVYLATRRRLSSRNKRA